MTQQNSNIQQDDSNDDEIDLIALAKTLWEGRKTVIKTTLVFMGIGLFVAIFSEKEFLSKTTFIPQSAEGEISGSLGGLAAMAGLNLGGLGGDSGISPSLYPQIINSIPFQRELLMTELTIEGMNGKLSFYDYYENVYSPSLIGYIKKYTIKLPILIKKAFKSNGNSKNSLLNIDILRISNEEFDLIERLKDQIFLEVNENEGYVTISANMPQPLASAELALSAQNLLQDYLIKFKIKKSKEQLVFIRERYQEKKDWFNKVQQELASFRDKNQHVNTALAQTKLETLQSEYDLAFGLYSELAKQWEAQQIKVTEDTPVFTVLEPVSIPLEKYKPKRIMITFIWTFLGGLLGVSIVFGKHFLKPYLKSF